MKDVISGDEKNARELSRRLTIEPSQKMGGRDKSTKSKGWWRSFKVGVIKDIERHGSLTGAAICE